MNLRSLALQVRSAIETAKPDGDVRLWFCRLCAMRTLRAHDLKTAFPCEIPLFAGMETVPERLAAASALLDAVPDEKWQDAALCGWLYQYANLPEREAAFKGLRRHEKISAAQIPAATQLFTPDWIVRCMVQNTLAPLCGNCDTWDFTLDTPDPGIARRDPADITLLDPCMGTGHILVYAFDALLDLYRAQGWLDKDAARRILTQNLCGLDIDRNAVLLGDLILRMKALPYLPEVLSGEISTQLRHFSGKDEPEQAEMLGSLLRPVKPKGDAARMLCRQYDAIVTNPPYMGSSGMTPALSAFVKENYPAGKADLFACFMERCAELTREDGCFTMIVQHAWMFLSSFRRLREVMRRYTLRDLVHLGARAFSLSDVGTIVQTVVFTAYGQKLDGIPTLWLRLTDAPDKQAAYFDKSLRFTSTPERFDVIPGSPLCYWMSDRMRELMKLPKLGDSCRICQGMTTSDNKRFLRRWYEVPRERIAFGCESADAAKATGAVWFPYNKGGRVRRWYGNFSWVVNYENDGAALRAFHAQLNKAHAGGRLKNADTYFRPAVTWSFITESTRFGVRYQPVGFLFDVAGSCAFPEPDDLYFLMGLLSSNAALEFLRLFNPTMNFQPENLKNLPLPPKNEHREEIARLVQENIRLAREDWDSREESWDYVGDPLLQTGERLLENAYTAWETECLKRICTTQENERRLNAIFAGLYGLQDELDDTPPASTLTAPDRGTAARNLVSYLAGCLMGRYECGGIAPIMDNFLPLSEMPDLLRQSLAAILGTQTLADNLKWLEGSLGMGLERYCTKHFYRDHCRAFHKRPIYWLASSGRQGAVCGLQSVHRFGKFPAAELLQICEALPPSEDGNAYLARVSRLSETPFRPDDGIPANHERFADIYASIR